MMSAVALFSAHADEQGNALVDALVKKGVLTSKEGAEIRAEMDKQNSSAASKMQLADHIQKLKIYGFGQLRYQYDSSQRNTATANQESRNFQAARFTINADYDFTENFSAGIALCTEMATASRTSLFDNAYTKNGDINLFELWLKWDEPFEAEWLEFVMGKQRLAHKFTSYSIGADVRLEGVSAKIGAFDLDDEKEWSVYSTHGVYFYDYTREDNFAVTANEGDNTYMYVNQVTLAVKPEKDWKIEVTPGFVCYSGSDPNVAPTGETGVDAGDLNVFMVDASVSHPLPENLSGTLYGEYGVNLSGDSRGDRLRQIGGLAANDDGNNQFFVTGWKFGENKKKGGWSIDTSYAYYETYSWDSNINDPFLHANCLNGHGPKVSASYNFTDFLTGNFTWYGAWHIDEGASSINGLTRTTNAGAGNLVTSSDVMQINLVWKY